MKKTNTKNTEPVPHPYRAIKRAAVPIVCFETADPQATIVACQKARNGKPEAWLSWDCCRGFYQIAPRTEEGQRIEALVNDDGPATNLTDCLTRIVQKYEHSEDAPRATFFLHCAHKALEDWTAAQAIWNLRDKFKAIGATLVLLGPAFRVPAELKHDSVVISEELPGEAELEKRAKSVCKDAGAAEDQDWEKIVDTVRGLSAFGAEQVIAMSVIKRDDTLTLDMAGLWERKVKMIEQTPGLSVWKGGESFADIGGCDNVKRFLRDILKGNAAPRAICFIDEVEKSLAANSSDSSGVSQDYLRALLTYMQDAETAGMIFIGPPGAAKSVIAKAAGNEANIPTISLDLGGMKGSLVGESEQRLRAALKVIDAVSAKQSLFIATCNSLSVLPPELKRRFTLGTFFFPLPSAEDRKMIWAIYENRFKLTGEKPRDENWTGAEIKQCAQIAWRLGCTLREAAKFIVPVAVSAKETIEKLCREASGKFISAANDGFYRYQEREEPSGRRFETV